MHIAFDSQIFAMQQYGGISRYICSLAAGLSNHSGVGVRVFAPLHVNSYLGNLPQQMVCGKRVSQIPRTGRLVRAFNKIFEKRLIDKFRPDIVHETYYSPDVYAPSTALRVVTVYDMIHERFASEFSRSDKTSDWKRIAVQRADHVICISESTRNDLLERVDLPEDKVSVIYLGHDTLAAVPGEKENHAKPFLLYVGQRAGYKNFERFLQAYASSALLRNGFNIVCFGGGAFSGLELQFLSDLGVSDNQVVQLGGDDVKLARLYRDAAAFVYPSVYEGFGIPPLEAMSMGCPVACSSSSSIPEVVGEAAEYFDPCSIESIRIAIENVLSSESRRAELIHLGGLRSKTFSWQRCVGETLGVYKGLL